MKHSCLNSRMALFNPFHGILLICMSFSLETATAATFLNVSDRLALLDFRKLITQDPHKIMSSWNDSIHFCNWVGVSCFLSNGRVVTLNLESQNLVGSIPPSIGNLTYLTASTCKTTASMVNFLKSWVVYRACSISMSPSISLEGGFQLISVTAQNLLY
ncbi:hypothetical protein OIU78_019414 [Salix suchowensis]|nr:hypothetical protein OIU78_019414 [Salix suchowensis]